MEEEPKYIEKNQSTMGLLAQMSHEFHEVYAHAMEKYARIEFKLIEKFLESGYRILQAIGLVAGFGFTGIGKVNNVNTFILGELFLVSSIAFGLYKIKSIYGKSLKGIQKSSDKASGVFKKRSEFFQKYINQLTNEGKISSVDFQKEMQETGDILIRFFEKEPKKTEKDEGEFLNILIALFIAGVLFLLMSFTTFRIEIKW